jgi:hypothetical protein
MKAHIGSVLAFFGLAALLNPAPSSQQQPPYTLKSIAPVLLLSGAIVMCDNPAEARTTVAATTPNNSHGKSWRDTSTTPEGTSMVT